MDSNTWFYLVETKGGVKKYIRNFTGKPMKFKDIMTATVMADALRHGGRDIEVTEIDLACEEPLL